MACVSITILGGTKQQAVGNLAIIWKIKKPLRLSRLSSLNTYTLCGYCHAFSHLLRFDFSDWWTNQWQILHWYQSNIEHYPSQFYKQTIWSRSQGSKWFANPLLGLSYQSCTVSRKTFYFLFVASRCGSPILDPIFFFKFKVTVGPDTSQILFACTRVPTAKITSDRGLQFTSGCARPIAGH